MCVCSLFVPAVEDKMYVHTNNFFLFQRRYSGLFKSIVPGMDGETSVN